MKFFAPIIVIFLVPLTLLAQPEMCGTQERFLQRLSSNPALAGKMDQIENHFRNSSAVMAAAPFMDDIYIPVVFHVVYTSAAQNLPDAKLLEQLKQLNFDFNHMNEDAGETPIAFSSLTKNAHIRFCLASRDPNGAPTTGIERRNTTVSSFSTNDDVKFFDSGGMNAWPVNDYLNIWIANLSSGLLGYAQFPGDDPLTDGIVVDYETVGSLDSPGSMSGFNRGRTAAHEVGHWLNLRHIWGDDGSGCGGSDMVDDTPNQGPNNSGNCPTFPATDACSDSFPGVMYMNYMDYSDDNCMNMFSAGQVARMRTLFNPGGFREPLLATPGCTPAAFAQCSAQPTVGNINYSGDTICNPASIVLTLSGFSTGAAGVIYTWQESRGSSGSWIHAQGTNGGTTYTTPVLSQTTSYRCIATCLATADADTSLPLTVSVYGISGVENDSICVAGPITLTAEGLGTVEWFEDAAGTVSLGTGNSLPVTIVGDTSFYARAFGSVEGAVGPAANTFGTGGNSNNFSRGLAFTVIADLILDTIFVYPQSAGNVIISLLNTSGGTINSITVPVATGGVKTPIPIGWNLTPGDYNLVPTGSTVSSLYRNFSSVTYPYSIPGIISITGAYNGSAGSYYFLYDWKIQATCGPPIMAIPVKVGPISVEATAWPDTICVGTGSLLSASGANSYTWNPGGISGQAVSVSPSTTQTYTVTGAASAGCISSDEITVEVIPVPLISINASSDTICKGSSVSLTGIGATDFTWEPGFFATPTINPFPSSTTTFVATAYPAPGCAAQNQVTIHVNSLHVVADVLTPTPLSCSGDTVSAQVYGALNYVWNPGGLTDSIQHFAPPNTITFTITGTDANGCTDVGYFTVYVDECAGILEKLNPLEVSVFPNPTRETIEIMGYPGIVSGISVWDLAGKPALQTYSPENPVIAVTNLPAGIYLGRIDGSEGGFHFRFVKE